MHLEKSGVFLTILAILLCFPFLYGQEHAICGSHHFQLKRASENLEYLKQLNEHHARVMGRLNSSKKTSSDPEFIIRIPVVVHLIGDNVISNAQYKVEEQIAILNEDYRRISGTNGFGEGVDTKIEFCLATVKPDGVTPTTGVTLHYDDPSSPYPSVWEPQDGLTNNRNEHIKAIEHWDEEIYLNLYVVEQMRFLAYNPTSGLYEWYELLGYATFPEDLQNFAHLDGVVIGLEYFGITTNSHNGLGRTLTHEVGHWLNLRHVWGDGGCEKDDFVDDTPICSYRFFAEPPCVGNVECSAENLLAGSASNVRPIENYMDYSDDICMNEFTEGQRERMRDCLFNERYSITYRGVDYIDCIETDHCSNGVQDFDERGVDCGGQDCLPCASYAPGGSTTCNSYLGKSQLRLTGQDVSAPFALTCNIHDIGLKHSCPLFSQEQVFLPNANGIYKSSNACDATCVDMNHMFSHKCYHYNVFFSIQEVDFNLTPIGAEHSKYIEAVGNCYDVLSTPGYFPGTSLPRYINDLIGNLPVNIEWNTLYKVKLGGNYNVWNSSATEWSERAVYFYPTPQAMNVSSNYELSQAFAEEIYLSQAINSTKTQTFYASEHITFEDGAIVESQGDKHKRFEISTVACASSTGARLDSGVQSIAPLFSPELIEETRSHYSEIQNEIDLYPNPNNGEFVEVSSEDIIVSLEVLSTSGMKVCKAYEKDTNNSKGQKFVFSESLKFGVYVVRLKTKSGKVEYQKMLVH